MNFRKSIVFPIIAISLFLPLGIAIITYTMHTSSLARLESKREKDKTASISFIIKAIVENKVKGIYSLSKSLQDNPEIAQDLAYYSMTGSRHVFDEVLIRLGSVLDSDIFLLTDKNGEIVKSINNEASGFYSVPGIDHVMKGESYMGMDDGPEGLAVRSFVPISWPLGGKLYGALVVGAKINYAFTQNIATETNTQITITGPEGNILATCAPKRFKQLVDRQPAAHSVAKQKPINTHSEANLISTTYLPITIANEKYCLIVQQDISQSHSMYKKEQQRFWVILSTIAGIVFLVMFWFVFHVIKPLRELESKTRQTIYKFSGQFDETEEGHEIDRLVRSFDFMLDYLNTYTKKLAEARDTAEKATRYKSEFLANMSHELRTPLNAILGFSELMSRDPGLSREQLDNLGTIGRSGEHLLSLINDVLEFSKIEAGRIDLHQENFNLHWLLRGLEEMFYLRAQQKGLSLNFKRETNVPQYICCDQNKLRQILINLLGNAIKFTKTGGITLLVTNLKSSKEMLPHSCHLHFEVVDTGQGISQEEQGRIFDAFFQSDDQDPSQQGTGLGLPISQKFANLLGGVLAVHSEVGIGTNISFDMPVELADGTNTKSSQLAQRVIRLAEGQPVFHLLVVEDNKNNRNLLVKLLRTVGFKVKEAVNGKDAIEICKKWQPHLIWMDMRMPVMDGYEATIKIKKSDGDKDIVIIALTASAFEKDRIKVLEHGANDFVRKPFRESEIFEMLSKHLGVQFIYETKSENKKSDMSDQKMQQAIAGLSKELKNDFKTAVDRIDFDKSVSLLEKIQKKNKALAKALEKPIKGYQFDSLQKLFKGVKL